MSEKILLHVAYPLWRKNSLVALARAKQLQVEGHDVTLSYCATTGGTCAVNYTGNPLACLVCQASTRRISAQLGLAAIPLKPEPQPSEPISIAEKKALVEGVLSGLISTFRLFAAEIRSIRLMRWIARRYYRTSLGMLAAFKSVVRQQQPDRIEVFNGRHACSKFPLLAAEHFHLPFNTLEVTSRQQPIIFHGHTAHDRFGIQRRILNLEPDLEFASRFFERRQSPSHNKFAKRHASRFTPPEANGYRRKVTFFLSSQDEFASLGKAWKSPFVDSDVISEASRRWPDYFFCVRFHPNQVDVGSDIISPFREVAERDNVQVYYPDDTANTYQLIDWSDVVVTFGSTVTVEACWRGKPAILLGPSFYDQLEVADTPASPEAFYELLGHELLPKDRTNAARVAKYFLADEDPLEFLECRGGKIRPHGFRRPLQTLGYLARYSEVVACQIIKTLARKSNTNNRHKADRVLRAAPEDQTNQQRAA
ncbi:MAG: hypothetical protein H6822_03820 [Planctomycetaceae bacterium]|nr:hypothetical protein [Planctomycetales bacterium]MCB9921284.1 hypothetical protein [Planctomycetaceae bacterium]